MKKISRYIFVIWVVALQVLVSCSEDFGPTGTGWLQIMAPEMDARKETRASTEEIDYLVSVKRDGRLVMSPTRYSQIDGRIALSAATSYVLIAESCTQTEAECYPTSYGQPRYAGEERFAIVAGESTSVFVQCSMVNAAFKVEKDPSFYYVSYEVKATLGNRSLYFTNEEQMGYFNVGSDGTAVLEYEVQAIDADGNIGKGAGAVQLKSRNLSKLNLKAEAIGGLNIVIEYDETFTPVVTDIVVP